MLLYFLILFGIYFLMLLMVLAGWMIASSIKSGARLPEQKISVVVPFRNEEAHLPNLLDSIAKLDYPPDKFEVILVNDHSTDESLKLAEKWRMERKLSSLIISLTTEYGKKQALQAGIASAQYELIATTDADCVVPANWLTQISQSFQAHHQFVFGLVNILNNGFWSRIQQMEFFSVMSVTLSAWGWGRTILCNGANLAFRKPAFLDVGGYQGNLQLSSGDDEFLLRKMVKKYGYQSIGHYQAPVITQPLPNLQTFLHQRIRWASKWGMESDHLSRWLAMVVLLVQFSWWPLLGYHLMASQPLTSFLIGSKVFLEFWILYSVSILLHTRFHLLSFLMLQVVYAPYVIWVALLSRGRSIQWKGRPIIRQVN